MTLRTIALGLLLVFSFGLALAADEIHWTVTGQTSVTFDWRGPESTIRYGLTTSYGQTASATTPSPLPYSSSGPFKEARITGLQENTLYHYSIGSGADHTFRTPPLRGASGFVIAAEGDIGDSTSYSRMPAIQQLIGQEAPAFVLMLGDLTYGNAHGQSTVDQHFNDVMVWSQDAAYMPIWGNHEWDSITDDLRNYKGRFDLPNPRTSPGAPAAGCCGEDWYWFDYGNVRFIAHPEPYGTARSDWASAVRPVMDEAQSDPAISFIVTFGHRPAYSSGHHPGSSTLSGILDTLGAGYSKYVLNLGGHSHHYERTTPQSGVVHVTAGTGGAALQQDGSCLYLTCTQPSWSAYRAMHLGFLKLRFGANSIEGGFVCGPAGGGLNDVTCTPGATIDAFTIGSVLPASTDTISPTVGVTSPISGATVSGSTTVSAAASDNVGVAGVRFFLDGAALGTEDTSAPYSVAWNTVGTTNGSHALSATVRDAAGNIATSSPVAVTVANSGPDITKPTVAVTSPSPGSALSGAVTIAASASDDVGVTSVQFLLDGANLGSARTTAPYTTSWDTKTASVGPHVLAARARDAAGNTTTSANVSVSTLDQIAPKIVITDPRPDKKVGSDVEIKTTTSDNVRVVGVQFKLDGQNVGSEDTSSPFTLRVGMDHLPRRTWHTLSAVARDAAGNTASASVRVYKD